MNSHTKQQQKKEVEEERIRRQPMNWTKQWINYAIT